MNEFTALGPIAAPGTSVFGYQRGDAVPAQVVTDWQLDDTQVCQGDLPAGPAARPAFPVPDETATRGDWEDWAIAEGMDPDQAASISMDDLQAWRPAQSAAADGERPADSAKKAEWVDYAVRRGADHGWAEQQTKADLQAWEPAQPTDTVAAAASEADKAS